MLRIGITGQAGFIGRHLHNSLGLHPGEFSHIPFQKEFFENQKKLDQFVSSCDAVVHLAALNRHEVSQALYDTNISLTKKLIDSLNRTGSNPHVLFASSIQEVRNNHYGQSKKEGRNLLTDWAANSSALFTGMIIPNVFGPFGLPKYNSVVATFCHQLTHDETPRVDTDSELSLIYVAELVSAILHEIRTKKNNAELFIPPSHKIAVSDLLNTLNRFKTEYQEKGIIPQLKNNFELNLFNTYRSYIDIKSYFPVKFTRHADNRGEFVEIIKINEGGQVSFSTTKPGVTRGNHFHTRKIERFAVIKGDALIQLRKTDTTEVIDFYLSGSEPAYVDMPVWYTHNIKNIGQDDLYTIFWINEFFNPSDTDTYPMSV